MATMTPTTHDKFIPEVWSQETIYARESKLVMAKLVERYDDEVADYGDLIHIGEITDLAANAVTPGTDVVPEANTETEKTITVNRHFAASFEIHDRTKWQAKVRLAEQYRKKAGYAIAKQIDTDLLGLYATFSQTTGGSSVNITEANILVAIRYLDLADAPLEDRHFVISPYGKEDILAIDRFTRSDAVGYGKGDSPIKTGEFGDLFGVTIWLSSNVPIASSTCHSPLFHKEAVGLAMQKEVQWEQNRTPKGLSDVYIAQALWGYAELRDNHAVDMQYKNS